MTMPKKPAAPRAGKEPTGQQGMTPEEVAAFERSFKRHEEALRRLAKS
jgi:hypothetical protein